MSHGISTRMNVRVQIVCAWLGPAFIVILIPVWMGMGFLPPVAPSLSAEEVAMHFDEHRTGIRLGATMSMQFCMFGLAWTAAIAAQLRRIEEGPSPVLTYLQLAAGTITYLLFLFSNFAWTAAAFRPDRDMEIIYVLNDYAWLALVMPVMPAVIQAFAIGLAILCDPRAEPIFPRWSGYFNLWTGVLFIPGAVATFFKTGPFAWDGLFDFWIPLLIFAAWIVVMAALVTRAARRQRDS